MHADPLTPLEEVWKKNGVVNTLNMPKHLWLHYLLIYFSNVYSAILLDGLKADSNILSATILSSE